MHHTVEQTQAGETLAKIVRDLLEQLPWSRARDLCTSGRVRVNGQPERDPARRMRAGDQVEVRPDAPRERPGVLDRAAIVHLDRDIVVVNKPSGLMTVPFDASDRDTLVDLTQARLRRARGGGAELGVVQRLDKATSGLLVFARTLFAKRQLQQQWRVHAIERRYQALVHGRASDATHDTLLVRNRGDGLRGSWGVFRRFPGKPPKDAQRALTRVHVLEQLSNTALLECQLETGRQHQIRIHLSEAGNPLVGEQVYIREHQGARVRAARLMLHARVLGFSHPRTDEPMRFECEPPPDFQQCLARVRAGGATSA